MRIERSETGALEFDDPRRVCAGTDQRKDEVTRPQTGVTVRAHVEELLVAAALVIDRTRGAIHPHRRMRVAEREQLRRELAGVISTCETVRIWLDKGAPS
jgi:hypothetical protein